MTKWRGKAEFKIAVRDVARELKVKIGTIYIRKMSNKWASITSDGKRLYFNEDLLSIKKELGMFVIYHELIHLKVPNHGKLFKSLMSTYVKNYESLEKELNYEM